VEGMWGEMDPPYLGHDAVWISYLGACFIFGIVFSCLRQLSRPISGQISVYVADLATYDSLIFEHAIDSELIMNKL
jgi:hypothetical protein